MFLTLQIEYSAAFFLLADHLQDAVNVCLNQLKDLQLAIAITRVYEGDQGPVLRKLLEEEVLNIAAQEGNRWLASWAFWMLHRRDMAVRALIVSLFSFHQKPNTDLGLTTRYRHQCIPSSRRRSRPHCNQNSSLLMTRHLLCCTHNYDKRPCRPCAARSKSRPRSNGTLFYIMRAYTIAWGVTCWV